MNTGCAASGVEEPAISNSYLGCEDVGGIPNEGLDRQFEDQYQQQQQTGYVFGGAAS